MGVFLQGEEPGWVAFFEEERPDGCLSATRRVRMGVSLQEESPDGCLFAGLQGEEPGWVSLFMGESRGGFLSAGGRDRMGVSLQGGEPGWVALCREESLESAKAADNYLCVCARTLARHHTKKSST